MASSDEGAVSRRLTEGEMLAVSSNEGFPSAVAFSPSVTASPCHLSLRLGHLAALTCHRHVIHSRETASLPSQREVLKVRISQGLPCVREAVSRRLREGLFSRLWREFLICALGTPTYIIHYSLIRRYQQRGVGDAAPYTFVSASVENGVRYYKPVSSA